MGGTDSADADENEGGNKDDGQAAKFVGPSLFPDSVSPYTTSLQLLYQWCAAKAANEEMPDKILVDAYVPNRAPRSYWPTRNGRSFLGRLRWRRGR